MQIHFTDFVTAANLLVLLGIYRKMSIIVPAQAHVDRLCRAQGNQRKRQACGQRLGLAANEREIHESQTKRKLHSCLFAKIRALSLLL